MAELNDGPYPPGEYPVVVIGGGPGGVQSSYFLGRLGVRNALLDASDAPGGMFRRFPLFQRLISWTKIYAIAERGTREYIRYDWNSLLADDPGCEGLVADVMDGTSYFPSRAEMEAGQAAFVERTRLPIRHGCRWEWTQRTSEGFVVGTSDGEYRCRVLVVAVGMTQAWKPSMPGLEAVPHYIEVKPAKEYAGRTVVVIGKRNSGFEVADALLPYARRIVLVSPSPVRVSVTSNFVGSARARYLQPYEDHVLGGGNRVLDAAIERVERHAEGWTVHARGTTVPGKLELKCDDVIAATGFSIPLGDLEELGVDTVGATHMPVLSPFWESSVPMLYFAGSASLGAPGLRKYGIGSSSGAVHGFRHNARVMASRIAAEHFGIRRHLPPLRPDDVTDFLLAEATRAPELWNQQSYLCRCLAMTDAGPMDEGIQPLQHVVDSSGPDAVAIAVETDDTGDIHPAVYVRRRGLVSEHILSSDPMLEFETDENRAALASVLAGLVQR